MSIELRLHTIDSLYDIVFQNVLSEGGKIFLGSASPRICRFCNQTETETRFRKIAHALPASIGNKRLILIDECDQCNEYFANTLEDSFGKYSKSYRTMFGIKAKRKVPSYKTNTQVARIDVDTKNRAIRIGGDEDVIFRANEKENQYTLAMHIEPYSPLAVYKALVKMALSTLEADMLHDFIDVVGWIRFNKKQEFFPGPHFMCQRFTPGPSFGSSLFVVTFQRRPEISTEYPRLMFLCVMGSIALQIGIPSKGEQVLHLPLFPIPGEDQATYSSVQTEIVNLTSNEYVRTDRRLFSMRQQR